MKINFPTKLRLGLRQHKRRYKTYHYWSLLFITFSMIVAVSALYWLKPQPIYFALVGPMTGNNAVSGQAMTESVELYIDILNQQRGFLDRKLALKIFDDRSNAALAKIHAKTIVDDPSIVGVLGHYDSRTSLAASSIYEEFGMPVITSSATSDELTKNNPWYFRTTFSNHDQAALMANYVYKVLNHHKASVVLSKEAFGEQLGQSFIKTARDIGLEIQHVWEIEADLSNLATIRDEIVDLYADEKNKDKADVLYLATRSAESLELIVALRDHSKGLTLVGSDAITSPDFTEKLKQYPQERSRPGYYTEDIYVTPPFLNDIAGLKAQQFQLQYEETYQHPPSTTAFSYYDAILTFTEALKRSHINDSESIVEQRQQLRQALWDIAGFSSAVEASMGSLYFDNNGNVVNIVPVGRYRNGHIIPALEQFQPLHDFSAIDDVLGAALSDQIINVNKKFMHRTQVVYTGIDFIEIRELDLKNGSFVADFYLWFRFKDEFDDDNITFINGRNQIKGIGDPVISKRTESSGQTTRAYRVKGKFKMNFDFSAYPLDRQSLSIRFRHKNKTREHIIYVTDKIGMLGTETDLIYKFDRQESFQVSGWVVNEFLVFQNFQKTTSTLGLPERFNNIQQIAYSQFNIHLAIDRRVSSFVLKNLMPMMFLVVLGYLVLFMPDSSFGQRITLSANVIIATSLFHLRFASNMSHVDYIVLIEYVFYVIYFLSMLTTILVIKEHQLLQLCTDEHATLGKRRTRRYQTLAKRLRLFGRVFYPFFIIFVISLLIYLYR